MLITLKMLNKALAYRNFVAHFKHLFPAGRVELTEELCVKYTQDFDWDWMAQNMLPSAKRWEYDKEQASWTKLEYEGEYAARCAKLFYKASQKK